MSEEVRKAIEKANAKLCEGVRAGDAAAMAHCYTEDACLLPPNSEMIRGKKAIEEFWGAPISQIGLKDATLTTVEIAGGDDTVTEMGELSLKIQPEGQGEKGR